MMIELIEEGPHLDQAWLKERADGWAYRLHRYRTAPYEDLYKYYRTDVLDEKGTTLIYSEEQRHESSEEAINWAEQVFVRVLLAHKRLPHPGVYTNRDDAIAFEERMKKYRRE